MIDEVAEVKRYLDGEMLDDNQNLYRACYMITKFYRKLGLNKHDTFMKVAEWVRKYNLTLPFSLIACVSAAYANEMELRCGNTVKISRADADCIHMYSQNKQERRVALALMCCAKAFAGEDGSFIASSGALSNWLGMDACNLRGRYLRRLQDAGFVEKLKSDDIRGWKKNYYRNAMRFRLTVPFDKDGEWELRYNDIRKLYEQVFGEPYD